VYVTVREGVAVFVGVAVAAVLVGAGVLEGADVGRGVSVVARVAVAMTGSAGRIGTAAGCVAGGAAARETAVLVAAWARLYRAGVSVGDLIARVITIAPRAIAQTTTRAITPPRAHRA
jgi:hypothetical protein